MLFVLFATVHRRIIDTTKHGICVRCTRTAIIPIAQKATKRLGKNCAFAVGFPVFGELTKCCGNIRHPANGWRTAANMPGKCIKLIVIVKYNFQFSQQYVYCHLKLEMCAVHHVAWRRCAVVGAVCHRVYLSICVTFPFIPIHFSLFFLCFSCLAWMRLVNVFVFRSSFRSFIRRHLFRSCMFFAKHYLRYFR